jgi:TonB family protein
MKIIRSLALHLPILCAGVALAQTPVAPETALLPADPAALLNLAAQANGLHGPELKPWHLHATWESTDSSGKITEQGSFEEWWAGENKWRKHAQSGAVENTVWSVGGNRFSSGHGGQLPATAEMVERTLLESLPSVTLTGPAHTRLTRAPFRAGSLSLTCVVQSTLQPNGREQGKYTAAPNGSCSFVPSLYRYCFDDDKPLLRIESTPESVTTFDSPVRFQNRFLSRAILVAGIDGTKTRITVDSVEGIDKFEDAFFTPPSDAAPPAEKLSLASGVAAGNRTGGQPPTYPQTARAERIQGLVTVNAVIQKDGTLGKIQAVCGPSELRKAATDAVTTWRYKPYLLNGQPVEVETQIEVTFSLGG